MTSYTHVTYPLVGNCVMWRITTREQVGVTAQRMLRSYGTRKSAMADSLAGNYAYFELPNALENVAQHNQSLALLLNNDDNDSSNGGQATAYQIQSTSNTQQQSYGRYIWYFHKDHLSSSTLITNGDGEITQQIDYLPYGEVFLERQHNSDPDQPFYATPYKFNGKELDEETGLYYYGARYMNPRLSIWYATDPMQEKYPNISSYAYCLNNPLLYIDKDGNGVFESIRNKLYSLYNSFKGNSTYEGSGWGHGLRRYIANKLNIDNDAANVLEAVSLSLLQSKEINITGQALNKLKNDPDMKSFETDIIKDLKNNPNYKKRFFSDEFNKVVEFGGKRAPGEMKTQAIHFYDPKYKDTWDVAFNELTWFVRHARVFANASVSKTGSITITYNLVDCFDVRPSEGRSVEYNAICKYLGILYHDILGGNDKINVKATWKVKK